MRLHLCWLIHSIASAEAWAPACPTWNAHPSHSERIPTDVAQAVMGLPVRLARPGSAPPFGARQQSWAGEAIYKANDIRRLDDCQ